MTYNVLVPMPGKAAYARLEGKEFLAFFDHQDQCLGRRDCAYMDVDLVEQQGIDPWGRATLGRGIQALYEALIWKPLVHLH